MRTLIFLSIMIYGQERQAVDSPLFKNRIMVAEVVVAASGAA